jgi:hypothetical protein
MLDRLRLAYEIHAVLDRSHRRLGLTFEDFATDPALGVDRDAYLRAADVALRHAGAACDDEADRLSAGWRDTTSPGALACSSALAAAGRGG